MEDRVRLCQERAAEMGGAAVRVCPDYEASGAPVVTRFAMPRSRSGHAAMARLLARAERIMERDPDEVIGERYMRRWHSVKTLFFAEYIHLYLGSDPTLWLHDHPWPSASICLRGVLREVRDGPGGDGRSVTIRPGTVALRPPQHAHRLELLTGPAVTAFYAGPRLRHWGWHLDTGWRHWAGVSRVGEDGVTRVFLDPPDGNAAP